MGHATTWMTPRRDKSQVDEDIHNSDNTAVMHNNIILKNVQTLGEAYGEIGAAGGQDYFVRVHALSLGGQGAVHQRPALQQAVEHRNQRVLMVVPPQAELLLLLLLVVVHGVTGCGTRSAVVIIL